LDIFSFFGGGHFIFWVLRVSSNIQISKIWKQGKNGNFQGLFEKFRWFLRLFAVKFNPMGTALSQRAIVPSEALLKYKGLHSFQIFLQLLL
jgi:hypothetical protein